MASILPPLGFDQNDIKDFLTGIVMGLESEGLLNDSDIISRKEHDEIVEGFRAQQVKYLDEIKELKSGLASTEAKRVAVLKERNDNVADYQLLQGQLAASEKVSSDLRRQLREIRTAHDEVHKKVYPSSIADPFKPGGIYPGVGVFPGGSWINSQPFEQHQKVYGRGELHAPMANPNRSGG